MKEPTDPTDLNWERIINKLSLIEISFFNADQQKKFNHSVLSNTLIVLLQIA